jgi:predicted adenylyl cyclase CyaB
MYCEGLNMGKEWELKYKIDNFPKIPKKIESSGNFIENDVYYDTNNYEFLKNGIFIRIRNKKHLEFKFSGNDSHTSCRESLFPLVSVNSENEDFLAILKALGINSNHKFSGFAEFTKNICLKVLAIIKKKRIVYFITEDIKLTLDTIKRLGKFIEIEKKIDDNIYDEELIKKQVLEIIKKMNIYDQTLNEIHVGYVELFLLKYNPKAYEVGKYKDLNNEKKIKLGTSL